MSPHLEDPQRASHESDSPACEFSKSCSEPLPRARQRAAVAAALVHAGEAVQQVVTWYADVCEADGTVVDTIQTDLQEQWRWRLCGEQVMTPFRSCDLRRHN